MSNPGDVIARETLYGRKPGKERFPITIEIERPFSWGDISPTEYACWVTIDPLQKRTDSHGEGPLQALCLALYMLRCTLDLFLEEGGSLTWENGETYRVQSLWPDKAY